ncbi:MAG TPA: tetratricopeptide repeat protein [Bryobacteraceae bacterium]|nr:tetratricopeptide repeat protein [Bryobacteraceae bacterium]
MQSLTSNGRILFLLIAVFAIGQNTKAQSDIETKPIQIQAPESSKDWLRITQEGITLTQAGRYGAAESRFRRALLDAEAFGPSDYRLWASLSNVAYVIGEQGDLAGAEKLYGRVLQLREQYLGPRHLEVASTLNNLAGILRQQARYSDADALLRRALEIAEPSPDLRLTGTVLNTLGLNLMDLHETARAEPVLRRSRAMFEQVAGADSLDVAKSTTNLANLYRQHNQVSKAEAEQRRAIEIMEKQLGTEHPLLVSAWNNLFTILSLQNREEEGEAYLRRALEVGQRAFPSGAPMLQIRANLATLEARRGHYPEAARILEEVIAAQERLLGADHPSLGSSLARYSEVLKKLHQNGPAKRAQARANAILKSYR